MPSSPRDLTGGNGESNTYRRAAQAPDLRDDVGIVPYAVSLKRAGKNRTTEIS